MRITKRQLRRIIRESLKHVLREQVLGYTPPSDKQSDDEGYETVGTMGVDVSLDDESSETQQASAQNVKSLSAQRQKALNKGDIETAEETGEQLSKARSMRG